MISIPVILFNSISDNKTSGYFGNKLFQISAAHHLAKTNGDKLVLPKFDFCDVFENPPYEISEDLKANSEYCEKSFEYTSIPYSKNMNLSGYFQSFKYFDRKDAIKNFKLKRDIKHKAFQQMNKQVHLSYDDLFAYNNICGVHIRIGDYANFPNHFTQLLNTGYYQDAIDLISSKYDIDYFLIFSNDIPACKKVFKGPRFIFCDSEQEKAQNNISTVTDFYLLSRCQEIIIGNSSYSWWAAYLNKQQKIIAPTGRYDWFGPALKDINNTKDLIPENWIKL